jgi:hypothetical protein
MQFENRFDELKHKLDLIPDADIKSEVYTIKKKVMPAYAMMIVLLMLVTGIIGLQFGLNTNYVDTPENVDVIELELMNLTDAYERESVELIVIDHNTRVFTYVGTKNGNFVIVFYMKADVQQTMTEIKIGNQSIVLDRNKPMDLLVIENIENTIIEFKTTYQNSDFVDLLINRDYTYAFSIFGQ